MDFSFLFVTFLIGIAASFIGGLTSGGGSFISIPFLIFAGLPPHAAVATDRFGSLGYVASAIYKFFKSKKILFKYVLPLSVISIVGAPIGALLVLNIDKALLTKIVGAVIVALLPLIVLKKDLGVIRKEKKLNNVLLLGFSLYFLSAIYDGFLGAGGGILVAYLLVFVFGFTYTEANATEKIPYALNALISLSIFGSNDIINYQYGVALLLGEMIGAYIGAHLAVTKGDQFVRGAFIVVALISASKLMFLS